MYRFMANKSEEMPEGRLSRNDLMHFYSMTPSGNTFKYTPGHERFPGMSSLSICVAQSLTSLQKTGTSAH